MERQIKRWPTKLRGARSKMWLTCSNNIEITWTIKFKTSSTNKNVKIYTVELKYMNKRFIYILNDNNICILAQL